MQIKEKFSEMLHYALAKKEFNKKEVVEKTDAVRVLAKIVAEKMVDVLSDNTDRDIMDFLYAVLEVSEVGEHGVAMEIILLVLSSEDLEYIRLLVEGFVLNDEESEMIFIEELVNTGTDYCFFRSIGLDGDEA